LGCPGLLKRPGFCYNETATGDLREIIAQNFGFNILFVSVGIFIIISAFLPLLILKEFKARDGKAPTVPEAKAIRPLAPKD